MGRQSISLTSPNDEWLKKQVETKEYSSKSELINDLIRQARNQQKELDWIRLKLEKSEKRLQQEGYVNQTREEILAEFKEKLKK
jgi:antitoxin ParD1/3/4